MNTINNDIKTGQFKNVYLLYGDEAYLKRQLLSRLLGALDVTEDDMNYSVFEGDSLNSAEIATTINTLPFLSERRVVLIKNSGFCSHGDENLENAISSLPDSSYVIFCENEVKKNTRLFKAISSAGTVQECVMPNENTLMTWIVGRAKRADKRMTTGAWNAFFKATYANKETQNMDYMNNEFEKVLAYCQDRSEITEADVEAIVSPQYMDKIFDMINAIGAKDIKTVMRLYEDLLVLKESPTKILSLICRMFRHLLILHDEAGERIPVDAYAQKLNVPSFVVQKYLRMGMLKKFPYDTVKELLNDALDTLQKIRSGQLNERIGVELLMIKYCH